jgi:hypothetical protein
MKPKLMPSIRTRKESYPEALERIYNASDEALKPIMVLKPAQIKRLEEIQLQRQGYHAFAEPVVMQALKLTDKQKKLFKSTADEVQEESINYEREKRKRFPSDFLSQELREAMAAGSMLRYTADRWALKLMVSHLTDEQTKVWQELVGKPFTIPRDDPGVGPDLPPQK